MANRKIVFYTQALVKGGAERVISTLANNMVKRKYEVYIILNVKTKVCYKINKNVRIYEIDNKEYCDFFRKAKILMRGRSLKLKKILEEIKPDIVISFLPESNLRCLEIKKYKTIISIRNDPRKEFSFLPFKYKMRKFFPKADGFVFQTNEAKKYFSNLIGEKGIIIYNPVAEKFYNTGYLGDADSIVTVGRLVKQKNHFLLINAFKKVLNNFPNYTLKIYGDGPLKKNLQKYINKNNLSDKVFLMGNVDDIENVVIHSKVFVLSSDFEGMPNSLIEAMVMGMPCISTNCPCGGPKELIKNNYNGILVPVNDSNSMCDEIIKVLSNSNFRKDLSKKSKKIYKKLNENYIVEQWIEYIESVISI